MNRFAFVILSGLLCLPTTSPAIEVNVCSNLSLPPAVVKLLRDGYPEWQIVTTKILDPSDAKEWADINPAQCPGMISAHLVSDARTDFVVNLVRPGEQKIVAFVAKKDGYRPEVLVSVHDVQGIAVLYRRRPGQLLSAERERFVNVATDAACLANPGAGELCYYWDGSAFKNLVTSE
jgi:hypothetical protein